MKNIIAFVFGILTSSTLAQHIALESRDDVGNISMLLSSRQFGAVEAHKGAWNAQLLHSIRTAPIKDQEMYTGLGYTFRKEEQLNVIVDGAVLVNYRQGVSGAGVFCTPRYVGEGMIAELRVGGFNKGNDWDPLVSIRAELRLKGRFWFWTQLGQVDNFDWKAGASFFGVKIKGEQVEIVPFLSFPSHNPDFIYTRFNLAARFRLF